MKRLIIYHYLRLITKPTTFWNCQRINEVVHVNDALTNYYAIEERNVTYILQVCFVFWAEFCSCCVYPVLGRHYTIPKLPGKGRQLLPQASPFGGSFLRSASRGRFEWLAPFVEWKREDSCPHLGLNGWHLKQKSIT